MTLLRIAAGLAAAVALGCRPAPSSSLRHEDAYRANNHGVALLEQFNPTAAAEAFRQAQQLDPALTLAHVNLAIALFYVPDLDAAARQADAAARLLPRDPRPPYLLGLIERARGHDEPARAAFERVLQLDPADVGSHINLGQLALQRLRYDDAIAQLRAALAEEPYSVTATYNLGLALTRAGRSDEGQRALERAQTLRVGGYGTVLSDTYLEQGRYAVALASAGAEPELVDRAIPNVTFRRQSIEGAGAASDIGGLTLFDFDGDGALDLCVIAAEGIRLLRNERGAFVDVTAAAGLAAAAGGRGVVAGDYDNDNRPDLLVLNGNGITLYHNDGNGRFSDATTRMRLAPLSWSPETAAFADVDHDGDLDVVLAGPSRVARLLRNNGNGTFSDITTAAGLDAPSPAIAIVPTDFNNRRDLDLLMVRRDGSPALFSNLRDGTFRDVAADVGLRIDGPVTSVAAADVNKDDYPDLFFGRSGAVGTLALSTGLETFRVVPAPPQSADARAAQFLDYDHDGLLDLLTWSPNGPHLLRNVGNDWVDVSARAFPQSNGRAIGVSSARGLAAGDVDGDGRTDLVVAGADGRVDLWHNDGAGASNSVRVRLAGRGSNRLGIGAKIDLRAGSLRQRIETSSATPAGTPADIVFGLGSRDRADVVRVLWPSGILQTETSIASPMTIRELDRKPSSCPFLFTWNGTRFEFVTDFLGGGETGYWEAPAVRNRANPVEYVRIRDDQLRPRAGAYELRVTNELEEAVFVDRVQLLAVTHPANVEVFPNEGMTDPPKPFRLFAVEAARSPARVVDEHGHDVTARVATRDRQYADDFELLPFRGYAQPHSLTVTIPRSPAPPLLLLTGWTDYAFSSDNLAAHQAGLSLQPPRLEVHDGDAWRTIVDDVGIPVGRPQTIVVDLQGKLPRAAGPVDVRIVTNMRIYWDQIQIGDRAEARRVRIESLEPSSALLRSRGFSLEWSPDGHQPPLYDYNRVAVESPWKTMPGRYTREGDVGPLLAGVDDRFVIARPGDEIALSFDARGIGTPPAGTRRTLLLYADGYSKEMDVNSASPDLVEPLPFHAMTRYPYAAPEHYPDTPLLRAYQRDYNTRIVATPVPSIDRWPLPGNRTSGPRP